MLVGVREIIGAAVADTCVALLQDGDYRVACGKHKIGGEVKISSIVPNYLPTDANGSIVYHHFTTETEIAGVFNNTLDFKRGKYKYPAFINISDGEEKHTPRTVEYPIDFVLIAPCPSSWTKDRQETELFRPIFQKVEDVFFEKLADLPFIIKNYEFPTYTKVKGYAVEARADIKEAFGDYIAYCRYNDFSIVVNTKLCEEQQQVILQKYNLLTEFLK